MMESTTGVILRTRPLTETSLIVHWLTPDLGRLSTVAKGARRPKSPFAGKLDLFYEADFSFTRSRRSDLHALREVSLRETRPILRTDLGYLRQASYAAALLEQTTETETPLAAIHQLMTGFLNQLPLRAPQPRNVYAFELKLLQELGLSPDLEQARLTDDTRRIVEALTVGDWPALAQLQPTAAQVAALSRFLHGFLIFHLGRMPEGRAAALALSKAVPRT